MRTQVAIIGGGPAGLQGVEALEHRPGAGGPVIRVLGEQVAEQEGDRARGGRIVRAFDAGLAAVDGEGEIVVKLDGDLHLPAHYFAWVCET